MSRPIHTTHVNLASPDLLHNPTPNDVLWTRANFEEAMPGVMTPLGWSFWGGTMERSSRRIYAEKFGVFSRAKAEAPIRSVADQTGNLYYGRVVANVDLLRWVMDHTPGADPDALELQVLGKVRPDAVSHPSRARYPAIFAKLPLSIARLPKLTRSIAAETEMWWRASTAPGRYRSVGDAAAGFAHAMDRFVEITTNHGFCVFIGQLGYDQLVKLAERAGKPGLELQLSASGQGTVETEMMALLANVSAGRTTIDEFVARYGFHGPHEGEVSSRSWREDRHPVEVLVSRYESVDAGVGLARTRVARREAERALIAALPAARREAARLTLRFADTYIPLREVGKASFLMALDVARAAARAAGALLVAEGRLAEPDDVFFLTLEELTSSPPVVDHDAIEARKARRKEYEALDIPDSFVGVPSPTGPEVEVEVEVESRPVDEVVRGVAASPGVVEGRARLITDPTGADLLEPGDVLVCELTDPGWTPYFHVAAAVVIDIGGPLSHGAIVAREVGIPCVINTGDGTKRIADGAFVRVDGSAGTVHIVNR